MQKAQTITVDGVEYVKKEDFNSIKNKEGLEYCIIRTYSAGCFAGYIDRKRKKQEEATIYNSRRLWYWSGASSLSQLAMEGVKNPSDCKFPCEENEKDLIGIIEVIPATEEAQKSINSVKIWKQ